MCFTDRRQNGLSTYVHRFHELWAFVEYNTKVETACITERCAFCSRSCLKNMTSSTVCAAARSWVVVVRQSSVSVKFEVHSIAWSSFLPLLTIGLASSSFEIWISLIICAENMVFSSELQTHSEWWFDSTNRYSWNKEIGIIVLWWLTRMICTALGTWDVMNPVGIPTDLPMCKRSCIKSLLAVGYFLSIASIFNGLNWLHLICAELMWTLLFSVSLVMMPYTYCDIVKITITESVCCTIAVQNLFQRNFSNS